MAITRSPNTHPPILGLVRHLRETLDSTKHATFSYEDLRASELHRKTLGIVGAGRIKELQTLMLNHNLLERRNVLFTPHIAFNTVEAVERILIATVQNIRAFLTGPPINLVVPAG